VSAMMTKTTLTAFCTTLVLAVATVNAQEEPLLVGEFAVKKVVDGDTILVEGLQRSIRFLCIDTEECEKGPGAAARTARLARDFAEYARERVRRNPIGTFNTPLGWAGKEFAEKWFKVGDKVRVEYDSLKRKSGYFGRVLGYVFVDVGGKWVNYNVECVRAGMSAYFEKYGGSARFADQFIAAEREARVHRRGIWSRYAMCYPNYDERIRVWSRRGQTLTRFAAKHAKAENAVIIMDEDGWQRLEKMLGKEVLLLGSVKSTNNRVDPPVAEMHHKQFDRLALTFADAATKKAVRRTLDAYPLDFLCFRGVLQKGALQGRRNYRFQMEVRDPRQVFADIPGAWVGRPPVVIPQRDDLIRWQDATQHFGQQVSVAGRIVRAKNIGKLTFLNFTDKYAGTLTLVIRKEDYAKFEGAPEKTYLEHVVLVSGKVTEHRGGPQIVITAPGQISILE